MAGARASVVTFLFSDIEGSTLLLRRLGDAYEAALEDHRRILRGAFAAHGGQEQGTEGDSFFVVFDSARDALDAAVAAQVVLEESAGDLRVRIGIHTGEAVKASGGYIGLAVHEAARAGAAGHGGQILISEATRQIVGPLQESVTLRDMGEHWLKDLERPLRLYQVCHPGLRDRFPPLRTLSITPNNMPVALTTFVGREHELADVVELIGRSRLVTLTGVGGIGKTRLAQVAAAAIVEAFADGVWLVELAPVSDPGLLGKAVVAAVGLRAEQGKSPADTFTEWATSRRLLLLLDNCEHMVAACADFVVGALARCPALKVLATSREPLGVAGEKSWRVPSLAIPDQASAYEVAAASDAVTLFIERAQAARPDFAVAVEDLPTLVDICSRLDGIPLALELAAARMTAMSLHQLASRLDDRFALLNRGTRTAAARHQTLRAAIDWSHDLLSDRERALFRRLAVFVGPFPLEAAEEIGRGQDLAGSEIFELLAQLVDRSLVLFDARPTDPHYSLLQTIRQYAQEQLAAAGEEDAIRQLHLDWCGRLAARGAVELRGREQRAWLTILEAFHDDLRGALGWGLRGEPATGAAQLAASLARFWLVRGHWTEGRSWLEQALVPPNPPEIRIRLLTGAAALMAMQGDYRASASHCEEALTLARESGREAGEVAEAHFLLGVVEWSRSSFDAARAAFHRALALHQGQGDEHGTAADLASLGGVAWALGELEEAHTLLEESLVIRRRIGDDHGIAGALNNLSVLVMGEGDFGTARVMSEESLQRSRELGYKEGIAGALDNLAEATEAMGDLATARILAEEGNALSQALGDRRSVALYQTTLGRLARAEGNSNEARTWFESALVSHAALGDQAEAATSLSQLAAVSLDAGEPEQAALLLGAAEALVVPSSPSLAELATMVTQCRDLLDDSVFEAAAASGRAMSLDEAVTRALSSTANAKTVTGDPRDSPSSG